MPDSCESNHQDPAIKNSQPAVIINMSYSLNSWLGTYKLILPHSTNTSLILLKTTPAKLLAALSVRFGFRYLVFLACLIENAFVLEICVWVWRVPIIRSRGEYPYKTIFLHIYSSWQLDSNATKIYQFLFFSQLSSPPALYLSAITHLLPSLSTICLL